MTRTDVMASSRPRTAGAASTGSRKTSLKRSMLALSALLLMVCSLALPGAALAAEGTTGYNQTPTTPTTPATPTTPTPTTGTSPSKETTTPASKEEPAKASTAPSTGSEKAATLPFTGFDLRWTVAVGVLLMGAGFSIVVMQRRERRGGSR
jgi:hypothetical protein